VISRLYSSDSNEVKFEGTGSFDSYLVPQDELDINDELKSSRLLSVDNYLFVPAKMHVRALVTSTDVLHC